MFGEKKANASFTYAELTSLAARIAALQQAHDEVVDWLAQELGLCVKKDYLYPGHNFKMAVSPRTFAVEEVAPVIPKLARCKKEK